MGRNHESSEHKTIRAVDASMKAEGFSASSKVKSDCHEMLSGKVSASKLVDKYIAQYKK